MALLEDYTLLSEDELDEKIQEVMNKIDMAYKLGYQDMVDQLLFHLDNMKLEMGDRLQKEAFEITAGRLPEQYNITDDDLSEESSEDAQKE